MCIRDSCSDDHRVDNHRGDDLRGDDLRGDCGTRLQTLKSALMASRCSETTVTSFIPTDQFFVSTH